MGTRSIIAMKISCSQAKEGAGIDGTKGGGGDLLPWYLWVSFKFPGSEPVQIQIPIFGSKDTPKGEPGDNNQDIGEKIQLGLEQAHKDGKLTHKQYHGVHVESKETPNPRSGPDAKHWYCRVVVDGVQSIDGGTD